MQALKSTTPNEATMAVPAGSILGSVLAGAALVGSGWFAITNWTGWPADVQSAGLVGAAVVAGVCGFGVIVIKPWKSRTFSEWMTLWLLGTVIRLILTPAATFLLYSSAFRSGGSWPLNPTSLTLAVALAYLAALLAETVVLALHAHRALRPGNET